MRKTLLAIGFIAAASLGGAALGPTVGYAQITPPSTPPPNLGAASMQPPNLAQAQSQPLPSPSPLPNPNQQPSDNLPAATIPQPTQQQGGPPQVPTPTPNQPPQPLPGQQPTQQAVPAPQPMPGGAPTASPPLGARHSLLKSQTLKKRSLARLYTNTTLNARTNQANSPLANSAPNSPTYQRVRLNERTTPQTP
jgi:hypothetical protein